MIQLKNYQLKALESLRLYMRTCDELKDADMAFYQTTRLLWEQGIPYHPIKEPSALANIPYICLRLPTGGGKTLLACHAIAVANEEYLKRECSLVLWLVPSTTIKDQTLDALKDKNHAYRQALDTTLGRVAVMDLNDALFLQKGVLAGSTVIIVSTIQAFRVEDKDGRKVYESAGALQHHFQDLPAEIRGVLDRDENGISSYSLANVMRIHRPLVIVDEAHNARTGLSFDTLANLRPSAIIEFTATPDNSRNPSNVLHSTSAAALKAESMIKLPIRLETKTNWKALLSDAVAQRDHLEKLSNLEQNKTGDYIRPIMLIQAQPRRQGRDTLTVEVIEKSLVEDYRIPENQIVRATGEDRGLDGVNLWDEKCHIRYVITVQALREGWDCPFAYVLCSVAEQRSVGAVEQILGRILRLPYCKERDSGDLNKAYAFINSPHFAEAANTLIDALIENGFNKQEAQDFIRPSQEEQAPLGLPDTRRTIPPMTITLSEVPDPSHLSKTLLKKIDVDVETNTIVLKSHLLPEEVHEFGKHLVMEQARDTWEKQTNQYNQRAIAIFTSPSERGAPFAVPALCIKHADQIELFEEEHLIEEKWNLEACNAKLTDAEHELLKAEVGQFGEIDIGNEGKIKSRFIADLNRQIQLIDTVENWTDTQLIYWLDKNLRFMELTTQDKELYLTKLIADLLDNCNIILPQLIRKKFELRKIIEEKIKLYRQEARKQVYQELLFGEDTKNIIVSPERCLSFSPDKYPWRFPSPASDSFNKHYYSKVGDLDNKGEEYLCARFLDQMEEVEFWVRNLDRQEKYSFWLQTSTDKFYPDFVCKLKDGRYLVVEYKGADRWSNDDSKEKRRLGELWALKSEGRCLFVMPKGKDWDAIKKAVKGN